MAANSMQFFLYELYMQSNTSKAMHTGYVESRLNVQAILTIRSPPVEGGLQWRIYGRAQQGTGPTCHE